MNEGILFSDKKQLAKICIPLFKQTPFNYFEYSQYYFDGHVAFLSINSEYFYEIYKKDLLANLEELHRNTAYCIFLSPLMPLSEASLNDNKFIQNINLCKNFDLYHRYFLVFNTLQYVETFVFSL